MGRYSLAQHPDVAIQLDGEPEPRKHPPHRWVPWEERGNGARRCEQQWVVRPNVLALVHENEALLLRRTIEQPARDHDLGPR
jgi:hypothetical protein